MDDAKTTEIIGSIHEVKIPTGALYALVPLYRDELELLIRAAEAWNGPGQIEADLASRQLNVALQKLIEAND